jgi:hypothetical protein
MMDLNDYVLDLAAADIIDEDEMGAVVNHVFPGWDTDGGEILADEHHHFGEAIVRSADVHFGLENYCFLCRGRLSSEAPDSMLSGLEPGVACKSKLLSCNVLMLTCGN